jgi:hypothetical protein
MTDYSLVEIARLLQNSAQTGISFFVPMVQEEVEYAYATQYLFDSMSSMLN